MDKTFLFSIDLEDVRLWMDNGLQYQPRVVPNTRRYLNWLKSHQVQCTFFVVGEVARLYPELIQEIIANGHEIALHSDRHIPVAHQQPDAFKQDLEANLEALHKAGANTIVGYRAPIFSIVRESSWAYPILASYGIRYSSSVLPAKSPLFGWPEFGSTAREVAGVLELPMSVSSFGPLTIPTAGGVYFRVFPWLLLKRAIQLHASSGTPLLSYFHPYDLDTEQERFMHPGIHNNPFFNYLMYMNRKGLLPRLDRIIKSGWHIQTYRSFIHHNHE